MKTLILLLLIMTPEIMNAQNNQTLETKIIAMEKAALERWNKGDVWGFLEISAADVVYFDPFLEKRIDGIDQLTGLYKTIEGQVKVDRYEMTNPRVQATDNMAVLTFNLISYSGTNVSKWNCTEVYRKENTGEWKIIQSHWSFTKPDLKQ